ncbi:hypothetical protein [Lignipirellula cremea]|uniref:Uncharacterized protein n=1 Tax=Lignipirellula cremea TaxID=2528010 RepID=A0A518DRP7_9BACT|nr:hypothetical protein [Lignipirellula cremea]QDU94515.1 hypothetical protein Pla8534_23060 [Lignipirellula cremea]
MIDNQPPITTNEAKDTLIRLAIANFNTAERAVDESHRRGAECREELKQAAARLADLIKSTNSHYVLYEGRIYRVDGRSEKDIRRSEFEGLCLDS